MAACVIEACKLAYMQSPHFCDMCHVLLYSNYPKNRKAIEKSRQSRMSHYVIQ